MGRTAELGRLEAALDRAEGGTAAAVFVAGESGVGKTRLLRELERRAGVRGMRVLRGDCLAFGADGLPYAPIAAALRGLARELEPGDFAGLVGPSGGDLARLLPELSATHAADEPAEGMSATGEAIGQARLFGLLRALLDRLAEEAPVLFAIEDLHWADRSTLEFLSSSSAACATSACCWSAPTAATSCTATIRCARSWPRWSAAAGVERLEVGASRRPSSPSRWRASSATPPNPTSSTRLYARSEGNAFFAEELLAASEAATGPLPANLRDVLNLRLDALPERRARRAARGRRGRPALGPRAARGRRRPARAAPW